MTAHAPEERVRPPRGPFFGKAWLTPRNVAYAAGAAIVVLFLALALAFRGRPMPRRAGEGGASSKRLDSRIAGAQDKLKADPQDIGALVELGVSLFEKGKDQYVDALAALEEARSLGALDPRIFYCLGVMYQEEGLFPFALEEYKKHLRHYPDDKEVRLLTGKLYYKLGLFAESVQEFERVRFTDPGDPMIEENLGLALLSAKQPERAKASFEALLGKGGDYGRRANFYLGQMALEAGDFPAAAERFSAAAAGGELPDVPAERLYSGLGMAMQKLSLWVEAKAAWENALKAAPGDAKATAALREVNRRLAAAKRAADAAAREERRKAEAAAKRAAAEAKKASKS
jgi:tetratricopeptide (TPR) repeat protein